MEATEETISMTMSTEREWGRYREVQPEEVIDAFQYTGSFPLAFLQGREVVRVSADPEYAIEIIDRDTEERWIGIRHGEYVVRFPQLGLRNYPAESFEYGFEGVGD